MPSLRLGDCADLVEDCEDDRPLIHAYRFDDPPNQAVLLGFFGGGVVAPLQPMAGFGEHRVRAVRHSWICPERRYRACLYHGPLPALRQMPPPALPPGGWILEREPTPELTSPRPQGEPLATFGGAPGGATLQIRRLAGAPTGDGDDPTTGDLGLWLTHGQRSAFVFSFSLVGVPLHYAQGSLAQVGGLLIVWVQHSERLLVIRAFDPATLSPAGDLISIELVPVELDHYCNLTVCSAALVPALDSAGRLLVALLDDPQVGFVLFDPTSPLGRVVPPCMSPEALEEWSSRPGARGLLTLGSDEAGRECLGVP